MPLHKQSWRAANYRMLGPGPRLDFLPCCPLGLLTLNPCSVPRKPRIEHRESQKGLGLKSRSSGGKWEFPRGLVNVTCALNKPKLRMPSPAP